MILPGWPRHGDQAAGKERDHRELVSEAEDGYPFCQALGATARSAGVDGGPGDRAVLSSTPRNARVTERRTAEETRSVLFGKEADQILQDAAQAIDRLGPNPVEFTSDHGN